MRSSLDLCRQELRPWFLMMSHGTRDLQERSRMALAPFASVDLMRDAEVRALLVSELASWHSDEPEVRIIDELAVCNGEARIDVAVLNGQLTGWEIKSPRDRLDRLPNQVGYYSQVCDEAWLVTDGTHLEAAVALLPEWWGVMVLAVDEAGAPCLRLWRKSMMNPIIDERAVVRLLWRSEALELLDNIRPDHCLGRAPRVGIWEELAAQMDPAELRAAVCTALKNRKPWRRDRVRRPQRKSTGWQVVATFEDDYGA